MSGEEIQRLTDYVERGGLARSAEAIIIFQRFSNGSVGTQTFGEPTEVGKLANVIGSIAECLMFSGEEDEK